MGTCGSLRLFPAGSRTGGGTPRQMPPIVAAQSILPKGVGSHCSAKSCDVHRCNSGRSVRWHPRNHLISVLSGVLSTHRSSMVRRARPASRSHLKRFVHPSTPQRPVLFSGDPVHRPVDLERLHQPAGRRHVPGHDQRQPDDPGSPPWRQSGQADPREVSNHGHSFTGAADSMKIVFFLLLLAGIGMVTRGVFVLWRVTPQLQLWLITTSAPGSAPSRRKNSRIATPNIQ